MLLPVATLMEPFIKKDQLVLSKMFGNRQYMFQEKDKKRYTRYEVCYESSLIDYMLVYKRLKGGLKDVLSEERLTSPVIVFCGN